MNFTIKFDIDDIDTYEYDDEYRIDIYSFLKLISMCFQRLKFGQKL